MEITERKLIEQAYHRHRIASIHAGLTPLTFPQWEAGLREEALREQVVAVERELVYA